MALISIFGRIHSCLIIPTCVYSNARRCKDIQSPPTNPGRPPKVECPTIVQYVFRSIQGRNRKNLPHNSSRRFSLLDSWTKRHMHSQKWLQNGMASKIHHIRECQYKTIKLAFLKQFRSIRKQVWMLNIQPKIKVFMWRTLRSILPTCERLKEKGIDIQYGFYLCHNPNETI